MKSSHQEVSSESTELEQPCKHVQVRTEAFYVSVAIATLTGSIVAKNRKHSRYFK